MNITIYAQDVIATIFVVGFFILAIILWHEKARYVRLAGTYLMLIVIGFAIIYLLSRNGII